MRMLRYALILLLTFTPLALAALLWFGLSPQPQVVDRDRLDHEDLARIRTLIKLNDPRRFRAGSEQRIRINEHDLNLVARYALTRYAESAARIRVKDKLLEATTTVRVPYLGRRPYLNLHLQLVETGGEPRPAGLRIGRVEVPDPLTRLLFAQARRRLVEQGEFSILLQAFERVSFEPGWMHLRFQWNPRILDQVRGQLMAEVDRAAVADYYDRLLELQAEGIGTGGSLTRVLAPLFERARERSQERDPVRENRALLAMLAAWAGGSGLERLLGERETSHQPFRMTLRGRLDLAQHLLISAALTAAGNEEISAAVGLYKEMADITHGSGFSFTDLAADRAGMRFGTLAGESEDSARRIQTLLSQGMDDEGIMPSMRGLEEGLRSAEFSRRYGDADSAEFQAVVDLIDRRIAACRLYSPEGS